MDRIVVVTGGFGVLGAAVGRTFASRGYKIALIDRADAPPPNLARELPEQLLLGGIDLTKLEAARGAIAKVVQRFGGIDALINVAGGFRWETLNDGGPDTWDLMYRMNVRTAVTTCKAALDHLLARGGGRVVNVAAAAALKAAKGMGAYTASKAGVMRLTEALAEEVKDQGITVNAVLPSIIDTQQNRNDMPDADFSRWVQPSVLAEVIFFLASDAASAITGASIPVTGRL